MILIRRAEEADFDQIWPLLRDVFRAGETYAIDPLISKEQAQDYWLEQPTACYVAHDGATIVGTYYIRTNQQGGGAHVCNCGYIVSPIARGKGVARQMCEHSQAEARALGYRAMQFNFVLKSNSGAVRLWQHLSYQIVGTIPDAFCLPDGSYTDAHVMWKSLL